MVIIFAALAALLAAVNVFKSKKQTKENGIKEWLGKLSQNFWTILLVITGAIVLHHGLYASKLETPSLASTGSWSQDHWLWILVFAIILAILITRILSGGTAAMLQTILWVSVFLLLIGFPAWNGIVGTSNTHQPSSRSETPLASSPQSSWLKLTIPAGGRSAHIPVPPDMHMTAVGNNFRLHNVFVDGSECAFGEQCTDGPLAGVYVTNEAKGTIIVSYAFAPK